MSVFSDINGIVSSGIPAITVGIFLLMFSEMPTIKLNYEAKLSSVRAGLSFVILAIVQIIGNFLFLFEELPLVEYIIVVAGIVVFVFFCFGVVFLFILAFEIWRELQYNM